MTKHLRLPHLTLLDPQVDKEIGHVAQKRVVTGTRIERGMEMETEIWKGGESGVIVETGTSVEIGMGVGSGIHLYDSHRGIQQPRLIYEKY